MGYCDHTGAELFALTRQRRQEQAEARLMQKPVTARFGIRFVKIDPIRKVIAKRLMDAHRSKQTKLRLIQNGRCYLCDKELGLVVTDEHVVPKALGGARRNNILLAHERCNGAKSNRPPRPCELIYLAAVNAILAEPTRAARNRYFGRAA